MRAKQFSWGGQRRSLHFKNINLVSVQQKTGRNAPDSCFFEITLEQLEKLREQLRIAVPQQFPQQDFVIKSLRADEYCFIKHYIESVIPPHKKQKLRWGDKRPYTVTANGVFRRSNESKSVNNIPLKTPQYKPEEKQGFSKAQSASLGTPTYYPPVFGRNTDRQSTLVGVLLQWQDVLFTDRNFAVDNGTVQRPYEFELLADAMKY